MSISRVSTPFSMQDRPLLGPILAALGIHFDTLSNSQNTSIRLTLSCPNRKHVAAGEPSGTLASNVEDRFRGHDSSSSRPIYVGKDGVASVSIIDLTKTFATVNKEALQACFTRLRCPPMFVNITRQLHDRMKQCVLYMSENNLDRATSTWV